MENQSNSISGILLCVVITYLLIWIFKHWQKRKWTMNIAKNIPAMKGTPFYGLNIDLLLCPHKDLFRKFMKYVEMNPSITRGWIGTELLIIISEPRYIKNILNDKNCFEKSDLYEKFKPYLGEGLVTAPMDKWSKHRKLLNPSFRTKTLNEFVSVFAQNSKILKQILEKHSGDPKFDIMERFMCCTLDNICDTTMGLRVDAQTCPNVFTVSIERLFDLLIIRITKFLYQFDFFFYLVHGRDFHRLLNNATALPKKIVAEQKRIFQQELGLAKDFDFLKCDASEKPTLLKYMIGLSQTGNYFTDQEIQDEINTFVAAATDTSSSTMSMCCLLLALYPEYQKKVYEEAMSVLGEKGEVTVQDLSKLQFLDMCLKETLRIFPVIPVVLRKAANDVTIDEFTIPKGSTMLLSMVSVHRSPEFWKNPLEFDPYRFLPENLHKIHPYSYIPFIKGPRFCIGQNYAFLMMKVILSDIIRKFEFKTHYKSLEELEFTYHITLSPNEGYKVFLKNRN